MDLEAHGGALALPTLCTTKEHLRAARAAACGSVGFVPTMGWLHEGHLSLVRAAREQNDCVVVSIFVNPTQFGPAEDFGAYPRDMDRDLALLDTVGADLVFAPAAEEMYPPGFSTGVTVAGVGDRFEGERRPGHFQGVATVVAKLLCIVQPTRAYFGQKDAQQCAVLKRMALDLDIPTEIVILPTMREPDGMAMSSRNTYLEAAQRAVAPVLYRGLLAGQAVFEHGRRDSRSIETAVHDVVSAEPAVRLEYVAVADRETLEPLTTVDRPALILIAGRIGKTRLIDNLILG